jgi:hypothetical protein
MATTLVSALYDNLTFTYTGTSTFPNAGPKQSLVTKWYVDMATGTGASQADLLWVSERTLAASASENLDLAGGLVDVFGNTLTFVKIKAILIKAATGNTNSVVVGGAGSNTFVGPFADATDKVGIPPNGYAKFLAPVSGWAVTAGTGDILQIANSGGTTGVTYDIIIVGTSA